MSYLPSHAFDPHPQDPIACRHPDGSQICAQLADNPIHNVQRPEVEQLAAALASYQWRHRPASRFAGVSDHRSHDRDWRCGICMGDLHAIATAVLDIQGGRP